MSRIIQARSIAVVRSRGSDAAPASGTQAATADDQRRAPRRRPRVDRAVALPAGLAAGRDWIPSGWLYVIVSMVGSIVSSVLGTSILPGPIAAVCLSAAVALAGGVGLAHRLVQRRGLWLCLVATCLVVVLPLFLFSLGMT